MGQITSVFLVFIPKHRLWVHVRCVSQSMFGVKIRIETFSFLFLLKLFSFYKVVYRNKNQSVQACFRYYTDFFLSFF